MTTRKLIRVRDVMKPDYDLVDGMDTIADILRQSKYAENKCFIVNARHEDDEYGIVTLSDIATQVLARDRAPERVNVYEIMSKPVISVHQDMDIRYCTRLFESFGLNRAPAVDGKKVVGIIGYSDIVLRGLRDELRKQDEKAAE
jgi:predicted transcriptional regulator